MFKEWKLLPTWEELTINVNNLCTGLEEKAAKTPLSADELDTVNESIEWVQSMWWHAYPVKPLIEAGVKVIKAHLICKFGNCQNGSSDIGKIVFDNLPRDAESYKPPSPDVKAMLNWISFDFSERRK